MRDTSLLFCCVLFSMLNAYASELPSYYNVSCLEESVVVSVDSKGRITINGSNLVTQFADTPDKWEIWPGFAKHTKKEPWKQLTIFFVSLSEALIRITDGVDENYNTVVDLSDVHSGLPGIKERSLILRHEQTYSNRATSRQKLSGL